MVQTTLKHFEIAEDDDSEYGHLVSHLIQQDGDLRDTNQWTRVFSRDGSKGKRVAIHLLGPDLIYDKSIRASLSLVSDFTGEVLFSPFLYKANDLSSDLAQSELPLDELISLG